MPQVGRNLAAYRCFAFRTHAPSLASLEVHRPGGLAVRNVSVGREASAPVKALRTSVLAVHRKPNLLRTRSGLDDVCKQEFHARRSNALPLPRDINGQVKQFCVRARVSKGNNYKHRGSGGNGERLPIGCHFLW